MSTASFNLTSQLSSRIYEMVLALQKKKIVLEVLVDILNHSEESVRTLALSSSKDEAYRQLKCLTAGRTSSYKEASSTES